MALRRGRKSSLVWTYVFETSSDSFQCVFCQSRYRRNATQIKTHLIEKCNLCPDEIKANLSLETERFTRKKSLDLSERDRISGSSISSNSAEKISKDSMRHRQMKPVKSTNSIDINSSEHGKAGPATLNQSDDLEDLKVLFARAIYSSSLPHSFVDNEHWKKFFYRLRPDFMLPSKTMLNTNLLDNEYRNVMKATEAYLRKCESLTIAVDGLSNVNSDGVINVVICTPSPVFYSSIDTKTNAHTSESLFSLLKPIIEDKGCKNFTAIISDQPGEMRSLGSIIRSTYPHILTLGCPVYCLNLLMENITHLPEVSQVLNAARSISTEIKRSYILNCKFQEISEKTNNGSKNNGSTSATIESMINYSSSSISRLSRVSNSLIKTILQISNGKQILRSLAMEPGAALDPRNREIILSSDFWDRLGHVKMIFTTIQDFINLLNLESCPISEVPTVFHAIQERITTYLRSSPSFSGLIHLILPLIASHKQRLVENNPVYYLANILDPRKKGSGLIEPELQAAEKFLLDYARMIWNNAESEIFERLIRSFSNFTTKTGYFESDLVWKQSEIVGPLEWWKFIRRHESHRYLAEIGIRLLSIPASNASVDRSFVQNGHQSEKRSHLSTDHDRLSKLLTIKSNLHLLDTGPVNPYEPKKTIPPNLPMTLSIVPDLPYGSDSDSSENDEAAILGNVLADNDFHYAYNQ